MVPDNHPAIISWELFDEISALREAEQAVKEERKKWCRQRRKNNPNIFKGRIFCKKCGEKLVCHWQRDGSLYFYCKFCHVSISEKDLWNGIYKELYQRLEEHKNLKKLMLKNSGKSNLETKKVALSREMEQQIQRLRTEKDQIFQPVKKDTDSLQAVMNTVGEVGDVMHLSQNVVGTFIDRIEVFNDERVKIRFTFEDTLKSYETG